MTDVHLNNCIYTFVSCLFDDVMCMLKEIEGLVQYSHMYEMIKMSSVVE